MNDRIRHFLSSKFVQMFLLMFFVEELFMNLFNWIFGDEPTGRFLLARIITCVVFAVIMMFWFRRETQEV